MGKIIFTIATMFLLASCGGESSAPTDEGNNIEEVEMRSLSPNISGVFMVDTGTSVVQWEGSKLAGTHHGVVSVLVGEITVEHGEVKQGTVELDLSTIKELDVSLELAAKLEKHLKDEAFFNVAEFPKATIFVTSVQKDTVYADLTIKGKTKSIEFSASIKVTQDNVSIAAKFTIDRTDWGIVYKSGNFFTDLAKDKIISDDIIFDIKMKATR
ncbi:MAG: polyisoprenoid-binding protein YceI [Saprospiraceae bacterium]|jgi:polyisoprenoid-binding protein YceI